MAHVCVHMCLCPFVCAPVSVCVCVSHSERGSYDEYSVGEDEEETEQIDIDTDLLSQGLPPPQLTQPVQGMGVTHTHTHTHTNTLCNTTPFEAGAIVAGRKEQLRLRVRAGVARILSYS